MGIIFWIIIVIIVGKAIGEGIGSEINVWNEKSYDKAEQRIAKKYDPTGYPKANVYRHRVGEVEYEQYKSEVNELRGRYGKTPMK